MSLLLLNSFSKEIGGKLFVRSVSCAASRLINRLVSAWFWSISWWMLVLDLVMKPGPAASWCIWAKQEPDSASETVESDWWRPVWRKTKKLDFWNSLFFCWISWLFFMSSFSLFIRLWLAKLQYRGRTWAGTGPKPPNQSAVNQSGYQVSMLTS